ncbi:TetR/AcrR family transcriptional regulator, partial [bacterium]
MPKPTFKTKKSEQTFERVFESACQLFVEQGYERTTMRDISKAGGLGLGALYYYFNSKEEVVLRFYEKVNQEVAVEFRQQAARSDLGQDFALLMQVKLKALAPNRDLLRVVIKEAVDPNSALCPLSNASHETRDLSLDLFHDIVARHEKAKVNADEIQQMSRGLWMLHMGILGYWLHDRSVEHAATTKAVDTAARLLTWSNRLAKIPGFSPLRKQVL